MSLFSFSQRKSCSEVRTAHTISIHIFSSTMRICQSTMLHMSYLELAAPNRIASQQLPKLPKSFLRGGLACDSVPVRLELAEAAKRQAHYLLGYLRGPWVWVKMALIKMEWTCLGSCETLSGVGFGAGIPVVHQSVFLCAIVEVSFDKFCRLYLCLRRECVCVSASACGLSWKRVLAASRVNVRRTWGRSHYHPLTPLLLTPPTVHLFPASPGKQQSLSLCLCLSRYHGKQHIATQPECNGQEKRKKKVLQNAFILLLLYVKK